MEYNSSRNLLCLNFVSKILLLNRHLSRYGQNDCTFFTYLIKHLYFIFQPLILTIPFNNVIRNNIIIFQVHLILYI